VNGHEQQGVLRHVLQRLLAVIPTLLLLITVVFFLVRGRIKVSGGFSGRTITRFNAFERFTHWLVAVSFIVLALTGLNITFGKSLVLPVIGAEAFSALSQWGKYAHNYLSVAFALGIVLIFLIWIKDNFPTKIDVEWLKRGGGLVGSDHPPARRFNGGQKLMFWAVVIGGVASAISGYYLIFPFQGVTVAGMQTAQIVHGIVGVVFAAIILAHIYIGTLGMEGAFDAMGTGEVDINWAKEHHSLWVEEEMNRTPGGARPSATPAE